LVVLLAALPSHDSHVFSVRVDQSVLPGSYLKTRISAQSGVTNWRFHDLRRTGATLMAEGGVQRFIIERVLGHADHTVTAVYDRATYRDEKRAALEVLAEAVAHIQHDVTCP
jgi:integrase